MTFPRAGCHTCKIRRIKCDDTKPTCQRCTKSRRPCLRTTTSPKPACFVIHLENSYASGEAKRPRGPRPTLRFMAASSGIPSAVLQPPQFDLQSRALANYLNCHLQTLADIPSISRDLLGCVPAWLSRMTCPMVDIALSSMALAVFSKTMQYQPAARDASVKYQKLLSIVQGTIPTLDERNIDACLLSIFLMSRYEDVIHRPSGISSKTPSAVPPQSFSHHDGALAILKIWKDRLSYNHPATDIIKHIRRGLIRSAYLRNLALPEWILKGGLFGEHGLELEYDCIIVRITNVRHQLFALLRQQETGLLRTSHELISRAEALDKEVRDIDSALEGWTAHIPGVWYSQRYTLENPRHLPRRHFYSSAVYSYSNPAYAFFWNHYFATRMLIDSTRLRALKLSRPNLDGFAHEQHLECLSHLKGMANNLASSIPFSLERFKVTDSPNSACSQNPITLTNKDEIKPHMANLTVWPLTIASSLEGVDAEQKMWFRTELAHVGRIMGAGILECAETDQWLEL